MLTAIAIDGADSPRAGCTTHLVSLLFTRLCREGYPLLDYPWLIRLDPAVPQKTRGNGALVLWLDLGPLDAKRVYQVALEAALEYARGTSSGKVGVAVFVGTEVPWPLRTLYTLAVSGYTPMSVAVRYAKLASREARLLEWRGRATGSLASIGAMLDHDYTFEILFYMPPRLWGRRPLLDPMLVKRISYTLGPYDIATYDYETGKPLIQPHGPDPVLAGIRSDNDTLLLKAARLIPPDYYTHATLYRTNQHTDAHLRILETSNLRPYTCGVIEGVMVEATRISGGHLITRLCDTRGCTDIAFYRETGRLRRAAEENIGRMVAISGCVRPHGDKLTLNAERLISLEDMRVYEPPASTWHHLYMPISRYKRIIRPRGIAPVRDPCNSGLVYPSSTL